MKNKSSNVDSWIKNREPHQVKALEKASKIFDKNDSLTVNTMEAVYGQESSFGDKNFLGTRGSSKAAGHFQHKKDSAIEDGLKVSKDNDERFDIDLDSIATAKRLKRLDGYFSSGAKIGGVKITVISDSEERWKFAIASYNIGQGRVAKAQNLAKQSGEVETKWDNVKEYLVAAGATKDQAKEAIEYVQNVLKYEKEFSQKSSANKKLKDKDLKDLSENTEGHWITLDDGRHVLIPNKS